jgi:hypothetical protein
MKYTEEEGQKKKIAFRSLIKKMNLTHAQKNNERYVTIKQSSGNMAMAILAPLLVGILMYSYTQPISSLSFERVFTLGLYLLIAFGFIYVNRINAKRQYEHMDDVMEEATKQD